MCVINFLQFLKIGIGRGDDSFFMVLSVLVTLPSVALSFEVDEMEFKKRIEACHTKNCLVDVLHIYQVLKDIVFVFERYSSSTTIIRQKRKMEAYINRLRGQLHEPEIFVMMEDGRWRAMTLREQKEWTLK